MWKFHYEKYKAQRPGKTGNCTNCQLKRVHLAYRMLCDPCARSTKMCPGCNHPPGAQDIKEGDEVEVMEEEDVYSSGDDLVDDEQSANAARTRRAEKMALKMDPGAELGTS